MRNDNFAIRADLEKLLGTQIQKILDTQKTELLQQHLSTLAESLSITHMELAAALLFLDSVTASECIKAWQNANTQTALKTLDGNASAPLIQQLGTLLKPTELKPEKLKMVRYRLEVGRKHQVSIEDIKNVLINESGVERAKIGYMDMRNHYTLIDLPNGMPPDIFQHLQSVEIKQQMLQIKRVAAPRKRQWQRRKSPTKNNPHKQQEDSKAGL